MRWRGKQRSVTAAGNIGVAVTGDGNTVHLSAPVRSAYREQVRRIAPPELIGREAELAALTAFCTTDSGPSYAWWRAEAWAGKTALMSWFALHPPRGVRVVPFFVTARLGAQNDITAYVDVVLEQLAELAGEGLPAHLTPATREAHLLRLHEEAARVCQDRGERLVLLVDGLDEDRGVTTGSDAHSIASLLPSRPPHGMRVLVTGRLNPPLPVDVPREHPLHDPAVVRGLEPSPYAQAVRTEAERELKHLIESGGLEYDLLGLVTAAGGGLTAPDLASLTGAVPYRVRDVLETRAGRTFGRRVSVYLLGHQELQLQAEEMLGPAELARFRGRLYSWADEWQSRGWPEETPEYLLRGYFRMALVADEVDRLLALAMDEARHDRMLEATGSDAAALTEILDTADRLAADEPADLRTLLRLAVRRDRIGGRNSRVSRTLCRVWAELGRTDKAVALARAIPDRWEYVGALAEVSRVLAAGGELVHALDLLAEAEEALHRSPRQDGAFFAAAASVLEALAELGSPARDRADRLADRITEAADDSAAQEGALALVEFWARTGRVARAEGFVESLVLDRRAAAAIRLAVVLAEAGDRTAADVLFHETWRYFLADGDGPPRDRLSLTMGARLSPLVSALLRTGDLTCAETVVTTALTRWPDDLDLPGLMVTVLVHRGELERAGALAESTGLGLCRDITESELARALARSGRIEEAEARAADVYVDDDARSDIALAVAESLAAAGRYAEAERAAGGLAVSGAVTDALLRGALAHAGSGARREAERFVARVEEAVRAYVPPSRRAGEHMTVAGHLRRAGHEVAARALLDAIEDLLPYRPAEALTDEEVFGYDSVVCLVAEELAAAGELERAEALLDTAFEPLGCLQAWAEVLRGRIGAAEYGRADAVIDLWDDREVADIFRGLAAVELAGAGWIERALPLADLIEEPQQRAETYAALATVMASTGQHDRARALLDTATESAALTPDLPRAGHIPTFTQFYRAYRALGDDRMASDLLAVAARLLAGRQFEKPDALLAALVETGWYDWAEALVRRSAGRGADSLIEAYVTAGLRDRAVRLAGLDDGPGRVGPGAAVALAPVVEESLGRALTARLLLAEGSWTHALPAVVRLEPSVVPWVVETLCGTAGPGAPNSPTAAHTSAPSAKRSRPATPEAPPSPTP
ncbi:hypothetical protein ABZ307_04625 [Streptomyces griseorubiginosus]|uniref:hypothetical protein n=1 Tax=Streptomyces griseorubiginosus TaxID=67304 RepID=UPI0033B97A81